MKKILAASLTLIVVTVASAMAADGAALYKQCAGCHGADGSKKAGDSEALKGQSSDAMFKKLQGYAEGSYGGAHKNVMENVAKKYPEEERKALADYIGTL